MKKMTWNEYYDGFFDWSISTQKSYSSRLLNFGDPEEVFEVVSEFAFYDQKFATRFVEKAFAAGVRFTPAQVLEMAIFIEKPVLSKIAEQTRESFTKEQLQEIYILIDDSLFERISKKKNLNIFKDDEEEEKYESEKACEEYIETQPKRTGLLTTLFEIITGEDRVVDSKEKKHNGCCNWDCANCPPHYGYRYGRWYYGHNHVHDCQFGGNRGSGSKD